MKKCLLCGQYFVPELKISQIFSWTKTREQSLCQHCLARFERLPKLRCRVCSGKLSKNAKERICPDCRNWQKIYGTNLLSNHADYRYNDAFHDLMVNYKRYGDYVLRGVLQELCYQELNQCKADFYIPVPTSPEHLARRQFDTISAIYGDLVNLTPILAKKEGQGAQGEKTKGQRLKSKQSFFVNKTKGLNLAHKKVLLLDDIYTTGRTLYHARDAILAAFPTAQIASFTICR